MLNITTTLHALNYHEETKVSTNGLWRQNSDITRNKTLLHNDAVALLLGFPLIDEASRGELPLRLRELLSGPFAGVPGLSQLVRTFVLFGLQLTC